MNLCELIYCILSWPRFGYDVSWRRTYDVIGTVACSCFNHSLLARWHKSAAAQKRKRKIVKLSFKNNEKSKTAVEFAPSILCINCQYWDDASYPALGGKTESSPSAKHHDIKAKVEPSDSSL
jgi:hypothetical protein